MTKAVTKVPSMMNYEAALSKDGADTQGGADNYSIAVSFDPKSAPVLSTPATLHITGNIDGSDLLRISRTGATWIHNYFDAPSNVTINGMPWDTVNNPTLPNSGATTFLPPGVDLSTVAFTKDAGRDAATYQLFPDHIDVYFADDPVDAETTMSRFHSARCRNRLAWFWY
jgi:hypothetical protein